MRWMWIDRILELDPGRRAVAIKHVSLAEDHLHDHFGARAAGDGVPARPPMPIMPGSLVIEGMAQTAGILVGHAEGFREKVILAKIARATLDADAAPGDTLRYTATIERMDRVGASTRGEVHLIGAAGHATPIGVIQMMFSHLDRNMAGVEFPEHNFVFGESFRTLLRLSGIDVPGEGA